MNTMSGPKTSRYRLTKEQLQILRQEMRRQEQTLEEKSKLKRISNDIRRIVDILDRTVAEARTLETRTGEGNQYIGDVNQIKKQADCIFEKSKVDENISLEQLVENRKSIESFYNEVQKTRSRLADDALIITEKLHTSVNQSIDKGFSNSFETLNRQDKGSDILFGLNKQLNTFRLNPILPSILILEIDTISKKINDITDPDFLSNFTAISVKPLLEKCSDFIDLHAKYNDKFNAMMDRYEAICSMLNETAKQFSFSLESLSELESIIANLEQKLVASEEQSYISQAIDEVMKEMGYDILGYREVKKKNGKRFRNELYRFAEGTAVNITYSSEGQITMELGGIDTTDRQPSSEEAQRLSRDMEHFCNDFKEVENRLIKKGVVLDTRFSMLPPEAAYAQIINASEYKICNSLELLSAKNQASSSAKMKTMKEE
jgi:hypothetical protein